MAEFMQDFASSIAIGLLAFLVSKALLMYVRKVAKVRFQGGCVTGFRSSVHHFSLAVDNHTKVILVSFVL